MFKNNNIKKGDFLPIWTLSIIWSARVVVVSSVVMGYVVLNTKLEEVRLPS